MHTSIDHLIEQRRSVRDFDPDIRIDREELADMLRLAMRAPSSFNLQPWRFVVFDTPEHKAKIRPLLNDNAAIADNASALILLLADLHHHHHAYTIIRQGIDAGMLSESAQTGYLNHIQEAYARCKNSREQALMDSNLAAMQLLLIAEARGYGSHVIGGFPRDEILDTLNLDSQHYAPIMLIALGKNCHEAATPASPRLPETYTVSWGGENAFAKSAEAEAV